jgi:hypothetical protein
MSERTKGEPSPVQQEQAPKGIFRPRPLTTSLRTYLERANMYPHANWDPSKERSASKHSKK